MPEWEYWTLVSLISLLILWYISNCFNTVREGWHYNIVLFGRWSRTISGVRDRIPDKEGNLIVCDGCNTATWFFIFYGVERIASYRFHWVEGMETTKIDPNGNPENIIWGKTKDDALVTVQRDEMTTHHKDRHDYRFRLNGLETGKKENEPVDTDVVENVKINTLLNSTIRMMNPFKAQFRSGGDADWYNSLYATITGTMGEVLADTIYADLGDLRGEKLQNVLVKNTEPQEIAATDANTQSHEILFKDNNGKRSEKITFIQRINYEMMIVKDLGIELVNITMMDFEPDDAYKGFVEAMQRQAISSVNVKTAENDAQARKKKLDVEKNYAIDILTASKNAKIELKKTEDVTVTKKAQHLANLRVLVESQSGISNDIGTVDVNKLINNTVSLDVAEEIRSESDDQASPPQNSNRPNQNRRRN